MCPFIWDFECQACSAADLRQVFNRAGSMSVCVKIPVTVFPKCSGESWQVPCWLCGSRELGDNQTRKSAVKCPFRSPSPSPSTPARSGVLSPSALVSQDVQLHGWGGRRAESPGRAAGGGHRPQLQGRVWSHVPLRRPQRGWSRV